MRALVSKFSGPPETLELGDLPIPDAGAGQVRIKVEACGINYPDVLMIDDRYQFKPERPFAPGIEICGRIDSVGEGVIDWAPGTRVSAQIGSGGLAEFAVADVDQIVAVPDAIGATMAASLLLTYGTSWHGLIERGALRSGETVLVLGAGGGVGLAAVQIAKSRGAYVVGAVSSEEKGEIARTAGADEIIIYPPEIDSRALAAQFKSACPQGYDMIYDPVGGDYAEPALRAINWEGRYLVVGFPAGIPRLPSNLVLLKGAQLIGVFWGAAVARKAGSWHATVSKIYQAVAEGELTPPSPTVYSLSDARDAISALGERRAVGKLVVTL